MRRWAYWWLFPIMLGIATARAEPVELTLPGEGYALFTPSLSLEDKTRAKLEVIAGADHFVDGEHELDLLDRVLAKLRRF